MGTIADEYRRRSVVWHLANNGSLGRVLEMIESCPRECFHLHVQSYDNTCTDPLTAMGFKVMLIFNDDKTLSANISWV